MPLQTIHAVAIEGLGRAVYCFEDEPQAKDVFEFASHYHGWDRESVTRFTFQAPLCATLEEAQAVALALLERKAITPIQCRTVTTYRPSWKKDAAA